MKWLKSVVRSKSGVKEKSENRTNTNINSTPTETRCIYCASEMPPISETKNSWLGYILCAAAILLTGYKGMILSIFIFPLSRQPILRCPNCLNEIGRKGLFEGYLGYGLQDKVMACKLGSFGIVITRWVMLMMGITIIVGLIIYFNLEVLEIPTYDISSRSVVNTSDITWGEYLADCGILPLLANPYNTIHTFRAKYVGRNVKWEGFFIKSFLTDPHIINSSPHKVNVLVKMLPDDTINGISLVLTFDQGSYNKYKRELGSLQRGVKFEFCGSLEGMGDDIRLHHIHGYYVRPLFEFVNLPTRLHSHGRYRYNEFDVQYFQLNDEVIIGEEVEGEGHLVQGKDKEEIIIGGDAVSGEETTNSQGQHLEMEIEGEIEIETMI